MQTPDKGGGEKVMCPGAVQFFVSFAISRRRKNRQSSQRFRSSKRSKNFGLSGVDIVELGVVGTNPLNGRSNSEKIQSDVDGKTRSLVTGGDC